MSSCFAVKEIWLTCIVRIMEFNFRRLISVRFSRQFLLFFGGVFQQSPKVTKAVNSSSFLELAAVSWWNWRHISGRGHRQSLPVLDLTLIRSDMDPSLKTLKEKIFCQEIGKKFNYIESRRNFKFCQLNAWGVMPPISRNWLPKFGLLKINFRAWVTAK